MSPTPLCGEIAFASALEMQQNAYREYNVQVGYITDEGLRAMPSDSDDAVIVQTHKPIQTKVLTWWAERLDTWPVVPGPELFEPNSVLVDHKEFPSAPRLTEDGKRLIYRISGMYSYAQVRPVRGNYPVATTPLLTQQASDFVVPRDAFDNYLAADNGNPGDVS